MASYPVKYATTGRKPIVEVGINLYRKLLPRVLIEPQFEISIFQASVRKFLGVRPDRDLRPANIPSTASHEGKEYDLSFGKVRLQLLDKGGYILEWDATVAFWKAPNAFNCLGMYEALECHDPQIIVAQQEVRMNPNALFAQLNGTFRPRPRP
jgi:hypothetical protein